MRETVLTKAVIYGAASAAVLAAVFRVIAQCA